MIDFPNLAELVRKNDTKIVMLVVDGLGGIPDPVYGRSELEAARIPNLDFLARSSAGGVVQFIAPGITVGSGPGHLALFGYDPLKYVVGRGVLEAIGAGLELEPEDVAARGNLATVDESGIIVDRRAGRITSEAAAPLVERLRSIAIDGVDVDVRHVEGYRFVIRLRGEGLSDDVTDSDPQTVGVSIPEARPRSEGAARTAAIIKEFSNRARGALDGSGPANAVMLRGWSKAPQLPSFCVSFAIGAAAIASYPMYQGIGRLVGMKVLETGSTFGDQLATLKNHWDEFDFFYLHYKDADIAGESGGFSAKKQALEALDEKIPQVTALKPDVFVVTGDHSTPSSVEGHSWHPVPLLLQSRWTKGEGIDRFNEYEARRGSLGQVDAKHVMLLALAHAGRLLRLGA